MTELDLDLFCLLGFSAEGLFAGIGIVRLLHQVELLLAVSLAKLEILLLIFNGCFAALNSLDALSFR